MAITLFIVSLGDASQSLLWAEVAGIMTICLDLTF